MKKQVLFTLIGSLLFSIVSYAQATYKVGDRAQGGIVVWVDETGQHGLVCATGSVKDVSWTPQIEPALGEANLELQSSIGYIQRITTRNGIYAGKENTERIITLIDNAMYSGSASAIGEEHTDYPLPYAARICALMEVTEGNMTYIDWYLPSWKELFLFLEAIATEKILLSNEEEQQLLGDGLSIFWSSSVARHTRDVSGWNIVGAASVESPKSVERSEKGYVLAFRAF